MFHSIIKSVLRGLRRRKTLAFINILGLAVGLCCAVLIYLYIADELSFDRFHEHADSIRVVMTGFHDSDGSLRSRGPAIPVAAGPLLEEAFPEDIEHTLPFAIAGGTFIIGDKVAREIVTLTDPSIFEVFTFPLLSGDADSALREDTSLVLTESTARKYFPNDDPIGQTLTIAFGAARKDFTITAIAKDPPRNSTIRFQSLVHIRNLPLGRSEDALATLGDFSYPLYLKFREGVSPQRAAHGLDAFTVRAFASEFKDWKPDDPSSSRIFPITLELQELKHMHLDARSFDGTDPATLVLLAVIALAVLLIAGINFVNLTVARAAIRSLEVGLRKVIGATRRQLFSQFWTETLVLVFFALIAGIILAAVLLPTFRMISEKSLVLTDLASPASLLGFGLLLLIVTAAAGAYPALVMSSVQPAAAFRGKIGLGGRRLLSRTLVVIQFGLSVFLVITTMLLGRQIRYMTAKDPGYAKEGLIAVRIMTMAAEESQSFVDIYRNRVLSYPGILSVSAANNSFGVSSSRYPLKKGDLKFDLYQYRVDPDYVRTVGLTIVAGRDFSWEIAGDADAAVVNEEFCRRVGTADPVGRRIGDFVDGPNGQYPYNLNIIGVVRDYNNLSFKRRIEPLILMMQPGWGMPLMLIRVSPAGVAGTLKVLEKTWKEVRPQEPFIYSFIEDDLEAQYRTEKKWGALVRVSMIFAIAIACMGIFGLTLLAVTRRFKEIGIRKVLGAETGQVFTLITRDFLLLVALANLIAWPAAYLVMKNVLGAYHYRIGLGPGIFLLTGAVTVLAAWLTIGGLAIKAALSDPIKAIRYE